MHAGATSRLLTVRSLKNLIAQISRNLSRSIVIRKIPIFIYDPQPSINQQFHYCFGTYCIGRKKSESFRQHNNNVTIMGYTKKTTDTGTPQLGSKGCSLCEDRAIPANLNAHVTDSQTCADIHLQLAMLRYDNAMCSTGQSKYRELCCTAEASSGGIMTALAFMVGALVTGVILKKIISNKKRRMVEKVQDNTEEELPGTVSFNSHSSRGKSRGSRLGSKITAAEVEMSSSSSSSSCYHKMEDPPKIKFKSNNNHPPHHSSRILRDNNRPVSRSKSRTRDIMQQSTHSRDNNRNVSDQNHSRSKSRTRDIVPQPTHSKDNRPISRSKSRTQEIMQQRTTHSSDNNRNVRDQSRSRPASRIRPREDVRDNTRTVSRTRDRSRPRDIISQHHSRDSSQSRGGRNHQRPQSRSRPRDTTTISQQHHSRDSRPVMMMTRSRPVSRSRPTRDDRSRSAGRGRSLSRGRSRDGGGGGGGRSRSQSRTRIIRPQLQHEVDIFGSDDDGLMLPTQLV
jgi:hypothetical protein